MGRQVVGLLQDRLALLREQVIAELPNREMGYGSKCLGVVRVTNQPGYVVFLVGRDGIVEKTAQGKIGERHLRRHALAL